MVAGHSKGIDTLGNYGHKLAGKMEDARKISAAIFDALLAENQKKYQK